MANYKGRKGDQSPNSPHVRRAPTSVSELIGKVVKANGLGKKNPLEPLQAAWRDALGRVTTQATRLSAFRSGVLTVEVDSAALAQELGVYYKKDLLKRLCEQSGVRVKDLRFKVVGRPNPDVNGVPQTRPGLR